MVHEDRSDNSTKLGHTEILAEPSPTSIGERNEGAGYRLEKASTSFVVMVKPQSRIRPIQRIRLGI